MKLPYAVRRYKGKYVAWTPFNPSVNGHGPSKAEAVADLTQQMHEIIIKVDGEIGEMEI